MPDRHAGRVSVIVRAVPWLCAAGLLVAPSASAQENSEPIWRTGALELKIGGRLQVQAGTSTCDEFPIPADSRCRQQVPASDLFLRRARLTVDARIDERLDLRIEPDYNKVDELGLKDAWGRVTLSPLARIKAGRFKRPFDEFTYISTSENLTIERPVAVRGLEGLLAPSLGAATIAFNLSDRDTGVELNGTTRNGLFTYWASVFTGASERKYQDTNSGKQFIGRVQFRVSVSGRPLKLIGSAAATDAAYETEERGIQSEYYHDLEVYAEWGDFGGGPHVQAGIVLGDNPLQNIEGAAIDLEAGDGFASFRSWQAIGSWKLPVGSGGLALEPLLRVTRGDPNADIADDAAWGFTPGLQVFLYKRNKVVLNWDFVDYESEGLRWEHSLKAQIQFHF